MPSPQPARFIPAFRGSIEGYAVKAIHQLYPRVKHRFDLDDLYQEAAEAYLFCRRRYVTVDNPAWFMALYKQVLFSRFAELISDCCKHGKCIPLEELAEQQVNCAAELLVLVAQMPVELLEVIREMLGDTENLLPSRKKATYRKLVEVYLGN